jgi:nucleotide-binding universal stress UspA family protein
MKSYLLALDGSKESLIAAELAWKLAAANDAKVLAQTVVDSQLLWRFIGNDVPGIIGTGPYMAAHETIHAAMKNVQETLLEAYDARARGHKVASESVLDEGITLDEITKRAKDHTFVIMGHRRGHESEERAGTWHYSLAERLACVCPKPLLIVQEQCEPWKAARLIVSEETYETANVAAFLEFAQALKLKPEIYCMASEESISKFTNMIKKSIPASENVRILSSDPQDGDPAWESATDVPLSTLLVLSTQASKRGRITCADTDPGSFIHQMRFPALVILPESKGVAGSLSADNRAKSLSKKG